MNTSNTNYASFVFINYLMKYIVHVLLYLFHHLKLVFNVFQIISNILTALLKKQSIVINMFAAFKQNGVTKLVFKTEGVFFIYVVGFGFIDQHEGEVNIPFANKKVKALFIGLKPCVKTIPVSPEPYTLTFKLKNNRAPIIRISHKPKLINQLQINDKIFKNSSINDIS